MSSASLDMGAADIPRAASSARRSKREAQLVAELPEDEAVLWTGRPDSFALAWDALAVRWIAGYAILLAVWRVLSLSDQLPWSSALAAAAPFLAMGAAAGGVLWLLAWVQARATAYAITDRRVAMQFGVATPVSLNLPLHAVEGAALDARRNGVGTIALDLGGHVRVPYIVLWPHMRPWHANPTQPALRCIPDAASAAALLRDAAAKASVETPVDNGTRIAAE
ncbi:MAG: photosynthetic complex putative assembly protein PuhB [Pseudomonadota bacterium]